MLCSSFQTIFFLNQTVFLLYKYLHQKVLQHKISHQLSLKLNLFFFHTSMFHHNAMMNFYFQQLPLLFEFLSVFGLLWIDPCCCCCCWRKWPFCGYICKLFKNWLNNWANINPPNIHTQNLDINLSNPIDTPCTFKVCYHVTYV